MLVECIRWALPQSEAMTAALALANMSGDLVGSKLSHRTLQGVLRLVASFDLSCSPFSLSGTLFLFSVTFIIVGISNGSTYNPVRSCSVASID